MSHIVKVAVEMKCKDSLITAAEKLGLAIVGDKNGQEHRLYGGQRQHGVGIQLEGWNYPVVVGVDQKTGELTGQAYYDNYGGSWGAQIKLDELVQRYTVEKSATEAMLHGWQTAEEELENGDVKLTLTQFSD